MARSSRIYVVWYECMDGADIIAAFTVKHELVTWLKALDHWEKDAYFVTAVPDGKVLDPLDYPVLPVKELTS